MLEARFWWEDARSKILAEDFGFWKQENRK